MSDPTASPDEAGPRTTERVCLSCLDGAGIYHNGAYKVLSQMGTDGEFHDVLEPCRCACHAEPSFQEVPA
jgi:hypothetical protein